MKPPTLARRLLQLVTRPGPREELEAELDEGFALLLATDGARVARRWYWRQVLTPDLLRARFQGPGNPARQSGVSPGTGRDAAMTDVRFAFRALARNRRFTLAIVSILAIGIGVNTAVFTLVNAVLLRPLPFRDADRLVMVFRTVPRFGFDRSNVSYPDYLDWRQSRTLDRLEAYANAQGDYQAPGGAQRLTGYRVTSGLLPLLGIAPSLGRTFSAADARPGAPPVMLLSNATWRARFGADTGIVGRAIALSGEPVTIIGVMPPGFAFPSQRAEFWMGLNLDPAGAERDQNFLGVIGRLAPGVALQDARTEMSALVSRIDHEAAGANRDMGVFIEPRLDFVVRSARPALLAFQIAVLCVLALACASVAQLMLSRAIARRRELAVRVALGATRLRLLRQALGEGVVVALLGGVLGVGLGLLLVGVVRASGAAQLPRVGEISLDGRVLVVAVAATVACGLLGALAPALRALRLAPASEFRESGSAASWRSGVQRLRDGLIVAQVAFAVILLTGAGLLAGSFLRLTAVHPGFDPSNVVAARVTLPETDEPYAAAGARRDRFFAAFAGRVAAIPGVQRTGFTYALPFSGEGESRVLVPEGSTLDASHAPAWEGSVIGGDYFGTIGIPLLRGRVFEAGDRADAPRVMIVSRSLAERLWPGADALGKRVRLGTGSDGPLATVVGIVADVHQRSLAEPATPMYYAPMSQAPWAMSMFVVARSALPGNGLIRRMRTALAAIDPSIALTDVAVGDELIAQTIAAPRFRALVLVLLGAFALVLAVLGVYGMLSLVVAERTREIGVRLALGAERGNVIRLVVGRGLGITALGIAIGLVGAIGLARFLRTMLYGVTPEDPWTMAGVALLLVVAALVSSYMPARRAARVDPLISLRDG